jgi:hypothetical protein
MKKLLSFAVASLAVAAVADTYSPTIGVTEVTTTLRNTIVAVPFTSLSSDANISANDLVKTANLAEGTALYIFNGTSYSAWVLENGAWNGAIPANTATGVGTPTAATATPLAKGSAIWLSRPASDTAESKTFYIYGKWSNPSSFTVAAGSQLVANPLQTTATLSVANPAAGDEIITASDDVPVRYVYRVNSKTQVGQWRKDNAQATLPTIPAGQGFWYVAASAGATISFAAPGN